LDKSPQFIKIKKEHKGSISKRRKREMKMEEKGLEK
jgi:hypothetical protein